MKSFLILIFLLINYFPAHGQAPEISKTDSISWAFDKIDAGQQRYIDSTFAINCFQQALHIGQKYKDYFLIHRAYRNIAYLYIYKSWNKKSLVFVHESIKYARLSGQNIDLSWEFLTIAKFQYKFFNFKQSLDSLSIAEAYCRKFGNEANRLSMLALRIDIYIYMQQLDLVSPLLDEALRLAIKLKKGMSIQRMYQNYGLYYLEKKEFDQALKYNKKSLKFTHFYKQKSKQFYIEAYIFNTIGDIYYAKKEYLTARANYLKSLKKAEQANYAKYKFYPLVDLLHVNIFLGDIDRAGMYRKEITQFSKFAELNVSMQIIFSVELARLNKAYNFPDSSIFYFKKVLQIIEKRKKKVGIERFRLGYNNMDASTYIELADIYKSYFFKTGNRAYFDSTFKYINAYRSRTLFENSEESKISKKNAYKDAVYRIEKSYRNIRIAPDEVSYSISDLDLQKRSMLSKRFEFLVKPAPDFKIINRPDFQNYLASINSAAIIYTFYKDWQYALYVDADSTKIIKLNIMPDNLKNKIKSLVSPAFYSDKIKKLRFNAALAHDLYRKIWAPIEDNIKLPRNIIIIPDENILNLPFDILIDEVTKKEMYSVTDPPGYEKQLLVQKYNFCYLPSANLIKTFHKTGLGQKALLVASPKFRNEYKIDPGLLQHTGWSFDPLLYSNTEVQSIKGLFSDYEILTGENATKEKVIARTQSSNIIHFATHAFMDSAFDLFSGLILTSSGDSTDTGFLLGYEIDKLNLNCDLVTLSACESGRGKIVSSEGVMGLPRLFFGAGANSVLMTLWKINDKQSAKFMPMFYKNLVQNKMSKMEALGEAKRAFLRQRSIQDGVYYSYPFYWAAFNLYGDGGTQQVRGDSFRPAKTGAFIIVVFISLVSIVLILRRKR